MMLVETELGIERLCPGCDETWPYDDEFWHMRDGKLSSSWPHRCRACCADYTAARLRMRMTMSAHEHRTTMEPIPGRCSRAMRRHERCGRRPGHADGCRSATAMATERLAKATTRMYA